MAQHDRNLVPQQPEAGDCQEWAIEPTGAPEEFWVDSSLPANGNPTTENYSVEKRRV